MLPRHPDQMTDEELDSFIRGLVDSLEPEGTLLDYKAVIALESQSQRREMAKDISSFANERGGSLIYGIPEDRMNPDSAPIPKRPYGIDPIPGLEQKLEDIYLSTIMPQLPEYRIRKVNLSEYREKVCYVVWVPESWTGPHMVQGYQDGRYYRRGQFRSVIMSERDVEARYGRRLSMRSAANEFLSSEDALHMGQLYGRLQAKTALVIVPLLLMPNRIAFNEPSVRQWLVSNTLWRNWVPSMRGVKTFKAGGKGERADVEFHRNGAIVAWRYTEVNDIDKAPVIASIFELRKLGNTLKLAADFYTFINYNGPLAVSLTIHCPESYALHLARRGGIVSLEPSGTSVRIRLEPSASELAIKPNSVLRAIADELYRAFALWEADCFNENDDLVY